MFMEHDLFGPAFARRSIERMNKELPGLGAGGKPVSNFPDHALAFEFEFEFSDRSEMTVDDVGRDRFDFIRMPARIAVFVDDRCANAFTEVVPGNARQGDEVHGRDFMPAHRDC